jgi:hypothetical protein
MSPRLDTSIPIVKRLLLFVIFAAASIFLTKAIFALEPGQSQRSNSSTIMESASLTRNRSRKGHLLPRTGRRATGQPL